MAASTTDKMIKTGASTVTTLSAPGKALAATSLTVGSTTNYPTDTGVVIAIRVVDSAGELVAGTYTEWLATVTSGTTLAIDASPVYGTDQVYAASSTTQVFIPLSSYAHNRLIDGVLVEHNQNGTHSDITADTITATTGTFDSVVISGSATAEGWSPLGDVPDTVTANGNGSFDLVFNGNDLTDTVSEGMRIKTARTVAAPDQCTSLNGTTQYYSKSSPSGMTFTDDFTVSAWIKLESYGAANQIIASRYNGTSGWYLLLDITGRVSLYGHNAGAVNYSGVKSYQSVPLNKWVHIAAQLDMSTYTATTTTSYVMFDGKDVPAFVDRAGTNPTALVQAGNFELGSWNGGLQPFPGKIAQVAIYSAKVTQATHLAAMNQGLTGSETSLISAYSFDNAITDLAATGNNLTANGSAVATTNDSPFGNSGVSTTIDYGIVMAKSFSTNTTLTIQVPEGCTIPTSGGVSSVDYSTQSVPYGFPRAKRRWELVTLCKVSSSQGSPTANTWYYSPHSIALSVPVGEWDLGYNAAVQGYKNPSITADRWVSLSTSTSAETETEFTTVDVTEGASSTMQHQVQLIARKNIGLSSATPYYLIVKTATASMTSIGISAATSVTKISAENAYI